MTVRPFSPHADLSSAARAAISRTAPRKRVGLAFSGGVDSTLLAHMMRGMGYDVVLLTIGFSDSHDVLFSRRINEYYGMEHHILEIDQASLDAAARTVGQGGFDSLSWFENAIAFWFLSRLARRHEATSLVTANGIDELFCGYDVYRREFGSMCHMDRLIRAKLQNELDMLGAIQSMIPDMTLYQPFLSEEFVEYAMTIPLDQKVRGRDDLVRKHAVRDLARLLGVPAESHQKRKKAMQYGTGIHRNLVRSIS